MVWAKKKNQWSKPLQKRIEKQRNLKNRTSTDNPSYFLPWPLKLAICMSFLPSNSSQIGIYNIYLTLSIYPFFFFFLPCLFSSPYNIVLCFAGRWCWITIRLKRMWTIILITKPLLNLLQFILSIKNYLLCLLYFLCFYCNF